MNILFLFFKLQMFLKNYFYNSDIFSVCFKYMKGRSRVELLREYYTTSDTEKLYTTIGIVNEGYTSKENRLYVKNVRLQDKRINYFLRNTNKDYTCHGVLENYASLCDIENTDLYYRLYKSSREYIKPLWSQILAWSFDTGCPKFTDFCISREANTKNLWACKALNKSKNRILKNYFIARGDFF